MHRTSCGIKGRTSTLETDLSLPAGTCSQQWQPQKNYQHHQKVEAKSQMHHFFVNNPITSKQARKLFLLQESDILSVSNKVESNVDRMQHPIKIEYESARKVI